MWGSLLQGSGVDLEKHMTVEENDLKLPIAMSPKKRERKTEKEVVVAAREEKHPEENFEEAREELDEGWSDRDDDVNDLDGEWGNEAASGSSPCHSKVDLQRKLSIAEKALQESSEELLCWKKRAMTGKEKVLELMEKVKETDEWKQRAMHGKEKVLELMKKLEESEVWKARAEESESKAEKLRLEVEKVSSNKTSQVDVAAAVKEAVEERTSKLKVLLKKKLLLASKAKDKIQTEFDVFRCEAKKKMEEVMEEKSKLEEHLSAMNVDSTVKDDLEKMQLKLENIMLEKSKLEEEVASTPGNDEFVKLQTQYDKLLEAFNMKSSASEENLKKLQSEFAAFRAEATTKYDNIVKEKTNLETEKTNLETEKNNLEIEKTNLETEKNNLEIEKNNLEMEKNNLEAEKNNLEIEKNNLEAEKNNLTTNQTNLEDEKAAQDRFENSMRSALSKLQEAEEKLGSAEQKIADVSFSLEAESKRAEKAEALVEEMKSANATTVNENTKAMKAKLSKALNKLKAMKVRNEQLEASLKQEKERCEMHTNESTADEELEQLVATLQAAKAKAERREKLWKQRAAAAEAKNGSGEFGSNEDSKNAELVTSLREQVVSADSRRREEIARFKEKEENANVEIEMLKSQLREANTRVEELEANGTDEVLMNSEEVKKVTNHLEQVEAKAAKDVANLKTKLENTVKKLKSANDKVKAFEKEKEQKLLESSSNDEVEKWKRRAEKAERELSDAMERVDEVDQLEAEIETAEEAADQAEKKMQEFKKRLEAAEALLQKQGVSLDDSSPLKEVKKTDAGASGKSGGWDDDGDGGDDEDDGWGNANDIDDENDDDGWDNDEW
eukprot:g993.t1